MFIWHSIISPPCSKPQDFFFINTKAGQHKMTFTLQDTSIFRIFLSFVSPWAMDFELYDLNSNKLRSFACWWFSIFIFSLISQGSTTTNIWIFLASDTSLIFYFTSLLLLLHECMYSEHTRELSFGASHLPSERGIFRQLPPGSYMIQIAYAELTVSSSDIEKYDAIHEYWSKRR